MRGVVELVYDGVKVLESENLIVDGGAELLTDIMTISPSLQNIPTASALLDSSNYTVQAISFGKDGFAYSTNSHSSSIMSSVYTGTRFELYVNNTSGATSSYAPINSLPEYPDPLDRHLQSEVSSLLPYIPDYKQNLNIFGLWREGLSAVPLFSSLNISSIPYFGCYAEDASIFTGTARARIFLRDSSGLNTVTSTILNSTLNYNTFSAIDWRGFITKHGSNGLGGFVVNSVSADDELVSSLGKVKYSTKIDSTNFKLANLYGGISTMGLWYIDIENTLKNGGSFPSTGDQLNTLYPKRVYKLFAKKVFNTNICRVQDSGTNAGLNIGTTMEINWSIYFI
jgi:hypothetical protein